MDQPYQSTLQHIGRQLERIADVLDESMVAARRSQDPEAIRKNVEAAFSVLETHPLVGPVVKQFKTQMKLGDGTNAHGSS